MTQKNIIILSIGAFCLSFMNLASEPMFRCTVKSYKIWERGHMLIGPYILIEQKEIWLAESEYNKLKNQPRIAINIRDKNGYSVPGVILFDCINKRYE